jgi:hypothetical protein
MRNRGLMSKLSHGKYYVTTDILKRERFVSPETTNTWWCSIGILLEGQTVALKLRYGDLHGHKAGQREGIAATTNSGLCQQNGQVTQKTNCRLY